MSIFLSGLEKGDVPISLDQLGGRDQGGVQRSTEIVIAPKMENTSSDYPLWLMNNKGRSAGLGLSLQATGSRGMIVMKPNNEKNAPVRFLSLRSQA